MHLKTMAVHFVSLQLKSALILCHVYIPLWQIKSVALAVTLMCHVVSKEVGGFCCGFGFYFPLIRTSCFSGLLDYQKLLLYQGSAM